MTEQLIDIPPSQIATLKKQLKVANTRLLSLERERQQEKDDIAALAILLKRAEVSRQ